MEREIREALLDVVGQAWPELDLEAVRLEVTVPRERGHGDYATSAAMTLAKTLRRAPREIARDLAEGLRVHTDLVEQVDIAGPGFINVRVSRDRLRSQLARILDEAERYGQSDLGQGAPVQVEYVSANPTGPLNVVNARAAAFGAALARILAFTGFRTETEFYCNNVGGQIDLLGDTFLARVREARGEGEAVIPEGGYQGTYFKDLALDLGPGEAEAAFASEDPRRAMAALAVDRILQWQERDLKAYGVTFDRWFRQSELYPEGVASALQRLRDRGHVYEKDDAVWFRATDFGDDQDRVLVRANGEPTYFLADLAYHTDKHDRGYTTAIDIWGPDHHGYIARMQAAMEALGFGRDWLQILIVQQVNLLADGKPVKMSKRAGEFITLEELIQDVGRDAAAFFFLMRRAESHLDFDMDLARRESEENPVFYVKYAHARICGLLRKAAEAGASDEDADLARLSEEPEFDLLKTLIQFPELLQGAALAREPHRITQYLREVSQTFHVFYHECRVIGPDPDITGARLALTRAARQVLANGLRLLGIEAPERM